MFVSIMFALTLLINPLASSGATHVKAIDYMNVIESSYMNDDDDVDSNNDSIIPSNNVSNNDSFIENNLTQDENIDLDITITDDDDVLTQAWATLDSLHDQATIAHALDHQRVNVVGTSSGQFATDTLFTLTDNDNTNYVFSKTNNHSPETSLTEFTNAEKTILEYNIPTCGDDVIVSNCLIENSVGDYVSIVF